MQPEPGDKNVRVTRSDAALAAQAVGIKSGDTVLFHSSLSSMGTVVGGPDTVIDGFLDAVGPCGTVAVPTLCNWTPATERLVFSGWNPATSPSYVGRITEAFRTRPDAVRSDQATHSVAAIGGRAADLTAEHGAFGPRPGPFGDRAFADSSPWQKLYEWNAAYCFIGVTFRVCTLVHYVETMLSQRALARAVPTRRAALGAELSGWMKPGVWLGIRNDDRVVLAEALAARGLVHRTKLGSATFRMARTRDIVDYWVAAVEEAPAKWLSEDALDWIESVHVGE